MIPSTSIVCIFWALDNWPTRTLTKSSWISQLTDLQDQVPRVPKILELHSSMCFWMFYFSFEVQTPQRKHSERSGWQKNVCRHAECASRMQSRKMSSPFSESIIGFEIRLGVQQELHELRVARPSHLELVSSRQWIQWILKFNTVTKLYSILPVPSLQDICLVLSSKAGNIVYMCIWIWNCSLRQGKLYAVELNRFVNVETHFFSPSGASNKGVALGMKAKAL